MKRKGKNYLVKPNYLLSARRADYKEQEYLNSVFETVNFENGTNGNFGTEILVNRKTKKIRFGEIPNMFSQEKAYNKIMEEHISPYQAISSALALYRLICLFPNPILTIQGSDGYKMPWEIILKHKETGEIVGFGEWKGAFSIRGTGNLKDYKEKTIKDFERLFNLILSNKSPHPYDGLVAGSVA